VIEMLKSDYPISMPCDSLTVSRSSFYYRSAQADESELREAVNQLAAQFPTYGSRRLAAQLRRAPYKLTVNRKRVQRVIKDQRYCKSPALVVGALIAFISGVRRDRSPRKPINIGHSRRLSSYSTENRCS